MYCRAKDQEPKLQRLGKTGSQVPLSWQSMSSHQVPEYAKSDGNFTRKSLQVISKGFFFLFLKTRTAPSTQGMSYGCNTIKVPDYNGQSKQEERNLNKYVELSSTRAKNERKKDLISRIECSQLSKLIAFCSCHIHHIMQCGTTHKPPNNYIAQPLNKQFNDPLRHSPMDTKQAKHHYPQLISYRAMKKKVIY